MWLSEIFLLSGEEKWNDDWWGMEDRERDIRLLVKTVQ